MRRSEPDVQVIRVSELMILVGSRRVMGQCVRPVFDPRQNIVCDWNVDERMCSTQLFTAERCNCVAMFGFCLYVVCLSSLMRLMYCDRTTEDRIVWFSLKSSKMRCSKGFPLIGRLMTDVLFQALTIAV